MAWRLAKSIEQFRTQVNNRWPKRSKASDGTIGNAEHSSRTSDHNPNTSGVVCAVDITHDPKNGCDSYVLAEMLLASRDKRIKYVISNRKIASGAGGPSPWMWRKYIGANPHNHHVHLSVRAPVDDTSPWHLDGVKSSQPKPDAPEALPTLRKGMKSEQVKKLQRLLGVEPDGSFGAETLKAVKDFQAKNKLTADGIAGPQTLTKLKWQGAT